MKTKLSLKLGTALAALAAITRLYAADLPSGCGNPVPPTLPPCVTCDDDGGSGGGDVVMGIITAPPPPAR